MITGNHEVLSLQKDKKNITCYPPISEVMSTVGPIEINGCTVLMSFADDKDPTIDQTVAEMLIESFMRRCTA